MLNTLLKSKKTIALNKNKMLEHSGEMEKSFKLLIAFLFIYSLFLANKKSTSIIS